MTTRLIPMLTFMEPGRLWWLVLIPVLLLLYLVLLRRTGKRSRTTGITNLNRVLLLEALLVQWQAARGGQLLRIALSEVAPIGRRRGWRAAYPVVQWSVTR